MFFIMKDTVDVGEPVDLQLAFKDISDASFDSLKVKIIITDRNGVQHTLPAFRQKPLNAGDTVHIRFQLDTRQFAGMNNVYVEVNPDNDQPEQYHLNNFIFKLLYVRPDTLHPFMDVTFDNVHILNHDIVSAKPDIVINLKDEAKWLTLSDPSVLKVQVKYPDGTLHPFNFDNDTLTFVPAQTPGKGSGNAAQAIFKPYFTQDGEYQLI